MSGARARLNRGVGAGYVGILTFELHFPEAGSLSTEEPMVPPWTPSFTPLSI